MNRQTLLTRLMAILLLVIPMEAFAQQERAAPNAEPPAEAAQDVPADQEVEINEDNYRQFMELKDALQQRTVLPENSYQSQAGLQKLDRLPEESQKHLRNQLREIIVQGGPWQPGDEEIEYPHVPSDLAATDQTLKKQEAEAWGELLDNYHAREAEIYANSSRSSAATAAAGYPGTGTGSSASVDAQMPAGKAGQSKAGQQADPRNRASPQSARDSFSPDAASDPNATSMDGTSQNAMEFLRKSGNLSDNNINISTNSLSDNNIRVAAEGQQEQSRSQPAEANNQPSTQANEQQDTQIRASQGQVGQQDNSAASVHTTSEETATESDEGVSQNALEFLTGESSGAEPVPADTLTIEDLVNARGVRLEVGTDAGDNEEQDKNPDQGGGE